MSDSTIQELILCCTGIVAFTVACFTISISENSNFQSLVKAWKEKRVAELEIEKAKALHERQCPRLTDTPRQR